MSNDNITVEDAGLTIKQGPLAVVQIDSQMSPELIIELFCCAGMVIRFPVKNLEDLSYTAAKELKIFGYEAEE